VGRHQDYSGRADTTVGPDHGLSLHAALVELGGRKGGYDAALTLNYERGPRWGYSLPDIYRFFEGRRVCRNRSSSIAARMCSTCGDVLGAD
jgi:hypothetical protein